MPESVRRHYQLYPYPNYPLVASVRTGDTYANNLRALWARFNGELPPENARKILIAGCGSFAPYPFAVANPDAAVTALDLSRKSVRRARLHCLLHGITGVNFTVGDLLQPELAPGPFGLIDAYGVLHHLADPAAGLKALAKRLVPGGIVRLMVYSRYTRREEESIRRALRLLKIREPAQVLDLVQRSKPDSRLRQFFELSDEVGFTSGLADALLHPLVHTYRIESLLDLVRESGLEPLLFAHRGALPEVAREVERIAGLEAQRTSPGNFVLYLGQKVKGPCRDGGTFLINPCLKKAAAFFRLGALRIQGRLGQPVEPLDAAGRRFLRRFRRPVAAAELSPRELALASRFADHLVLLRYRP